MKSAKYPLYLPSVSLKHIFKIIFQILLILIYLYVNFCGYSKNARRDFHVFIFILLFASRETLVLLFLGSWFLLCYYVVPTVNKDNK